MGAAQRSMASMRRGIWSMSIPSPLGTRWGCGNRRHRLLPLSYTSDRELLTLPLAHPSYIPASVLPALRPASVARERALGAYLARASQPRVNVTHPHTRASAREHATTQAHI